MARKCKDTQACSFIWRRWFDDGEKRCAACEQDAPVLILSYLRDEGDYAWLCPRCVAMLSGDADRWLDYETYEIDQWSYEDEN